MDIRCGFFMIAVRLEYIFVICVDMRFEPIRELVIS